MGPSSLIESWEINGNSENSFRNHVLKTGPTCSQHIWPMQILPQPKSTKWTPPSPPLPCLIRHSTRYNVFRVFPVFWVLGVFRVTKTNIQSFQVFCVFRVFRVWNSQNIIFDMPFGPHTGVRWIRHISLPHVQGHKQASRYFLSERPKHENNNNFKCIALIYLIPFWCTLDHCSKM